jgi:hypothetical protein
MAIQSEKPGDVMSEILRAIRDGDSMLLVVFNEKKGSFGSVIREKHVVSIPHAVNTFNEGMNALACKIYGVEM